MPNILDENGITIVTQPELVSDLVAGFELIYGTDISVASDTPDGQMINLFAQAILDVATFLMQVFNSFDPDNAIGNVLDQRVAINGIVRKGATYTITPITVVVSQALNLYGLDQTTNQVFTVSDNAGNLWELVTTQMIGSPGSYIYLFQAALPGAVTTNLNTITTQVTVVLGVTSVNNPSTYTQLGTNEETDAALKIRRQQSVSLASQGYLSGLIAALENIEGMTSTYVYENITNSTDGNGVPGHSIWVIVAGTAAVASIAQAIYDKRNAGCGMKGSISYGITQVDGSTFNVYWDDVVVVNLFIAFTATSINGVNDPNVTGILAGLPTSFVPTVFQEVNINALATQVQVIDPNTLVTNAGFSTGQTQVLNLSGVPASGAFTINYNGDTSASIAWNDSISTIQTKARAVTGLSTITVTGSLASRVLTFDLSTIESVSALIFVETNSLATSAPVAITFSYDEGYTPTLTPSSKQYQFVVSSANIIIIPIQLTPVSASVEPLGEQAFASVGGYGSYAYSISVNNSGGSIDASSGLYTAGSTPNVVDTIKVVDSIDNEETVDITVT